MIAIKHFLDIDKFIKKKNLSLIQLYKIDF